MAKWFVDPPDVTPSWSTSFVDIDITSHVDAADQGNVGVAFFMVTNNTSSYAKVAMRGKGQTFDPISSSSWTASRFSHITHAACPDSDDIVQAKYASAVPTSLFLLGYLTADEFVAHSEPVDKTTGSSGTWQTVTLSGSPSSPAGVILQAYHGALLSTQIRDTSDTGLATKVTYASTMFGPVDGSDQYDLWIGDSSSSHYYELGYITADAGFNWFGDSAERIEVENNSQDDAWYTKTLTGLDTDVEAVIVQHDYDTSSGGESHIRGSDSTWDLPTDESSVNLPGGWVWSHQPVVPDASDQVDHWGASTANAWYIVGEFAPSGGGGGYVNREQLHRIDSGLGGLHPIEQGIG